MRSPFLLRYRLSPNQLRPQVQLRPAPLCRGRLMHIHNKILSLYAEANGLCNRSPWLCLLLSCSKDTHNGRHSGLQNRLHKMRCYGPSPFWSAASRDQPHPLNGQYKCIHNTTFVLVSFYKQTTSTTFSQQASSVICFVLASFPGPKRRRS